MGHLPRAVCLIVTKHRQRSPEKPGPKCKDEAWPRLSGGLLAFLLTPLASSPVSGSLKRPSCHRPRANLASAGTTSYVHSQLHPHVRSGPPRRQGALGSGRRGCLGSTGPPEGPGRGEVAGKSRAREAREPSPRIQVRMGLWRRGGATQVHGGAGPRGWSLFAGEVGHFES